MASLRDMLLSQELAAAAAMSADAYGRFERYSMSSAHGFPHYQQAGNASGGFPDTGFLVSGFGMPPSTFIMPAGTHAAAGYGAEAVPVEIPVVRRQTPASRNARATPSRGPWTDEEDELLRRLVDEHGEHKWATISKHLPGRIGKQCRERWTNHVRPGIKKDHIWTEADDILLIHAHKIHGNRWSTISRCLPGRSENAIKNHWNATKRSLKSKRRRDKRMADENVAPLSPSSGHGYDGQVFPNAAAMLAVSNPPGMGQYLHPANAAGSSSQAGMTNLRAPLPDLNADSGEMLERYYYPASLPTYSNNNLLHHGPEPAFPQMVSAQGRMLAACTNLKLFPLPQYLGGGYYGSETGSSSAGGSSDQDEDVVQMAPREFQTSDDETTLDLTGFN
uniref:Transcription factor MYB98 n=1 Tax=Triticum urartu TaxID=4572 RepID=A0A8R7VHW4_TRIUA